MANYNAGNLNVEFLGIDKSLSGTLDNIISRLERLEKVKSEILSTDINTVKSYASLFRKIAQQSILFTVGNENKIREFDEIKVVKKLV